MIKKILSLVVLLALVVLVYAATLPDTYHVERSSTMKASQAEIFAQISDVKNVNSWSPWMKKDPAIKVTYSGPARGKGAMYAWEGNSSVGKGSSTITESVPNSKVVMALTFEKPMKDTATSTMMLAREGTGTKVTWSMDGKMTYVAKVFCVFMSMDKIVGGDFETGLANLKAIVEK